MSKDLYTRYTESQKYQDDILEVGDKLSQLVLQIENLLFTNKREVIGFEDFGISLEDIIFTLNANENDIKKEIITQITTFCPLAYEFNVNCEVTFVRGKIRDIGLVDIFIDGSKTVSLLL